MPHLVHFLLRHALIGFALAIVFVGLLLALDVARLGSLILASPTGVIAAFVLTFSIGVTFASVQMGFAVMLLSETDTGPRGGRGKPIPALRPAFARLFCVRGRKPGSSRMMVQH